MATNVDALRLRRALGVHAWAVPEPFGPDGWVMRAHDGTRSVIASCAEHDGAEWLHASMAGHEMPGYAELVALHRAVFVGYAYQVFAPPDQHVNIHPNALHLWGRLDGKPALPEFGAAGTI